MQEKIQVLEVELDNCSAKEAMKRVVEHMSIERLNIVEMVTMNTLARFQESEEDATLFEAFDLVLPSDRGILQAAGIQDERRLKEHYIKLKEYSIKIFGDKILPRYMKY